MKRFSPFRLVLLLVCTTAATACKKDSDSATGLDGQWRLTERQCECLPGGPPEETVTFKDSTFAFHSAGRLVSHGTFRHINTASICGVPSQVPALRFLLAEPTQAPQNAGVHLEGNTLVLDYGAPCDAPLDTYKRVE